MICLALGAVIGFVALVMLTRAQGAPVIVGWLQGTLTPGTDVGPLPVRWWARIGKGMQFLAGCSVALDLVDPQTVRQWGRRLRDWHRSYLDLLRNAADRDGPFTLAVAMRASMVSEKAGVPALGDPFPVTVAGSYLQVAKVPDVMTSRWVPQRAMDAWHADVRRRLPDAHRCSGSDCGVSEAACFEQEKFLTASIDEFLRRHYGDRVEPIDAFTSNAERLQHLTWIAGVLLCASVPALCAVPALVLESPRLDKVLGTATLVAMTLITIVLATGVAPRFIRHRPAHALIRGLLWVASVPGRWLLEGAANVLDAARPAHLLRYIAFGLFVAGFLPDLLAT